MIKTVLLGLLITLSAGVSAAAQADSTPAVPGLDELTAQEGRFQLTLIHPDADFSRYDKLYPSAVLLKLRTKQRNEAPPTTGSKVRRGSKRGAVLSSEDKARYEQAVVDALVAALGRSEDFQMVEGADAQTLILQTAVVDLVSKIPSKPARLKKKRGKVVAEGTIVFDLIDPATGLIQARVGERREIRLSEDAEGTEEVPDPWVDVAAWAHQAVEDLLGELHRLQDEDSDAEASGQA